MDIVRRLPTTINIKHKTYWGTQYQKVPSIHKRLALPCKFSLCNFFFCFSNRFAAILKSRARSRGRVSTNQTSETKICVHKFACTNFTHTHKKKTQRTKRNSWTTPRVIISKKCKKDQREHGKSSRGDPKVSITKAS